MTDTGHVAFALSEEYQDIVGATMAGGDGETIDLMALLEDDSDGSADAIVTNDPVLVNSLGARVEFERVDIPESWTPPVERGEQDLMKLTRPELVELAAGEGLEVTERATKAEIIEALQSGVPETTDDTAGEAGGEG